MLDIADLFPFTAGQERARVLRGSSSIPVVDAPRNLQSTPQRPAGGSMVSTYQQQATEAADRGLNLLDAEPDLSQYKEYARQRSNTANQDMLIGLAAQQAGEQFQPLAGMYLKRAMAAREPTQVGKAGMITPEGEFMADPFYQREKRAELLLKRAEHYDKLASTTASAEERRLAAEQAAADRRTYQQMMLGVRQQGLDMQREGMALRSQLGQQAAEDRETRASEQRDRANFGQENTLRQQHAKVAAAIDGSTSNAQTILSLAARPGVARDPAAQTSLIFAFGKMLDPTSTVREGEYKLFEQSRGWLESLGMTPERIRSGARLSPAQIERMASIAQQLAAEADARKAALDEKYHGLAQSYKLRPENVVPGFTPKKNIPVIPGL